MPYHRIVFPGNIPSKKNQLRRINRGGRVFTVPSEAHEAWEKSELPTLIKAGLKLDPPYVTRVNIYPSSKRKADSTNKIESINDLLVKAGIIQDDNWFLLQDQQLRFVEIDRLNPRIEVEIWSGKCAEELLSKAKLWV